jgi:hypothetical protein
LVAKRLLKRILLFRDASIEREILRVKIIYRRRR